MIARGSFRRRLTDGSVRALSCLSATTGVVFLGWILLTVVERGAGALTWSFFSELPLPPGNDGGGLANAILGTLMITGLGTLMGIPLGLCAGVYLAEFSRGAKLADVVRFLANTLMGLPSIVIGMFVYSLIVTRMGHFSGWAGAVALAIIMLPVVARTTEDILRLIPNNLRESALALGMPHWRMINGVVFRAARSGLMTGVLLALARASGETAPLLFTALNSPYWPTGMSEPTANLPVTIFNYAMSPYPNWQQTAWGAALVITLGVLGLNLFARVYARDRKR